jgi:hypothetical protein
MPPTHCKCTEPIAMYLNCRSATACGPGLGCVDLVAVHSAHLAASSEASFSLIGMERLEANQFEAQKIIRVLSILMGSLGQCTDGDARGGLWHRIYHFPSSIPQAKLHSHRSQQGSLGSSVSQTGISWAAGGSPHLWSTCELVRPG